MERYDVFSPTDFVTRAPGFILGARGTREKTSVINEAYQALRGIRIQRRQSERGL
jgi:hypothetical protein